MLTQDGLFEMSLCSSRVLISNKKLFKLQILAAPSNSEERTPQNQIWVRDRRRKVEQKIGKGVSYNHLNPSGQAVTRGRDRGWKSEQKKEKELLCDRLNPSGQAAMCGLLCDCPEPPKRKKFTNDKHLFFFFFSFSKRKQDLSFFSFLIDHRFVKLKI